MLSFSAFCRGFTVSRGLAGMFDNMGPGLEKAFSKAGPFLQMLADELPNIGNAMKSFFDSIADGAPFSCV